jgi:hypothetical protein
MRWGTDSIDAARAALFLRHQSVVGSIAQLHMMSAIGTKRTCSRRTVMSAFGGKADIAISRRHVRY